MPVCENCGKIFEEWEEDEEFQDTSEVKIYQLPVNYEHLLDVVGKCLCAECAADELASGNYRETCEKCYSEFEPAEEYEKFVRLSERRVTDADMYEHGILCADCAWKRLEDELVEENEENLNEYDEYISVEDAADIWRSHGKDEDYMFGYTEEELEEA